MEARAELIARARLICGEQHVLTHPAVLSTYRSDGRRRHGGPLPLAAILPGSASEVAGIVSACAALGVPYVVRGAGTSTGGGALAGARAVLLVLSRMRRIVRCTRSEITVEAGAPVTALPQPSGATWFAQQPPAGTVGGHVAETPGIANLSALQLVHTDGTLLQLDDRQPGYDVAGAFPGSRGRAGTAVALTLRAVPAP